MQDKPVLKRILGSVIVLSVATIVAVSNNAHVVTPLTFETNDSKTKNDNTEKNNTIIPNDSNLDILSDFSSISTPILDFKDVYRSNVGSNYVNTMLKQNSEETFSQKVRAKLPELVVSKKDESEVRKKQREVIVSKKGESKIREELPKLIVSEKGEPEVREELPEFKGGVNPNEAPVHELPEFEGGVNPNEAPVHELPEFKGGVNPNEALVHELPELVVSEKGEPEVREELPEFEGGVVPNEAPVHELPEFEGGVNSNEAPVHELPEFDGGVVPNEAPVHELPELVVSEKGEPEVREELPEFKGGVNPNEAPVHELPEFEGGVNPNEAPVYELPEFDGGVVPNEAPVHEVPEFKGGVNPNEAPVHELPELVVSEKGEPEIREELPELVVSEKGEPEVREELPELVVSTKARTETKVLKPTTVYMEDVKLNKGEKRVSFAGENGSLTITYEDLIDQDGKVLESKKIDEKRIEPVVKVVRYGVKKQGELIGESGLYHFSEHASDADIIKFNFNIKLTADEIVKLGQDEIEKRSDTNVENNLWLAGKPGWHIVANAPVSDEVIDKLNTDAYIDHKRIGLESLRLVNEERKRLGKKELVWSDDLHVLAKERATELGLNGHIRFWNDKGEAVKHVRDNNGTPWYTISKDTKYEYRAMGENLAGYTLPRNVYRLFNEKLIAKMLYEQWRNSPGHYANMMADDYTEFAFDLRYSKFWRNDRTNIDYLAQGIQGVQMFAV